MEKKDKDQDLPVAGQEVVQPTEESRSEPVRAEQEAPAPQRNAKQVPLDVYCRKVSARVPPETLSVFYTREMHNDRLSATLDEFESRLQEFMQAPLG